MSLIINCLRAWLALSFRTHVAAFVAACFVQAPPPRHKITIAEGMSTGTTWDGNTLGNTSELKSDIALGEEAKISCGWLEAQAPSTTAPSGIGVENYDWYLKNVPLALYTCEQEVALI